MKNRVIFLDRDGTINEEVGYLDSVERMRLIAGSAAAVKMLNDRGFKVVVVTNQAGVARGFFPESSLEALHGELIRQLREEGARVDAIYYCPHHPREGVAPYLRDCDCRKPAIGLLQQAARDLNLDLPSSYMVGDHISDVECGLRAGGKGILLLTGHGRDSLAQCGEGQRKPTFIAQDLHEAVQWILQDAEK